MSLAVFLVLILHLDAKHEVAEGTVDVLAAALHRRVVGRVHGVHRELAAAPASVKRVHLDVAGTHLARGRRHGAAAPVLGRRVLAAARMPVLRRRVVLLLLLRMLRVPMAAGG